MKNYTKYHIFARIGRTELSSSASEDLLKDLVNSINKKTSLTKVYLFQYPIFSLNDWKNYLFYKGKNSSNYIFELHTTSIKFIRDIIYIYQVFFKTIKDPNKNIILYNINSIHLYLIYFLVHLFNYKIIIIQADGITIPKHFKNLFKSIIVFSDYARKYYKSINFNKVYFSYPAISTDNNKLNNTSKKLINFKDRKPINLVHCGSISEYNLPYKKLKRLSELCISKKNIQVLFTSSQKKLPDYFLKFIQNSPENIKFIGNLNKNDLGRLLENANYGLDLRDTTQVRQTGGTDFPSKILLYVKYNLDIISSRSFSIPYQLRKRLLPFENIENCLEEYTIKMTGSIKDHIQENSLNKILIKAIEKRK